MSTPAKLVVARHVADRLHDLAQSTDPLGRVPLGAAALSALGELATQRDEHALTFANLQALALLNAFARRLIEAITGRPPQVLGRQAQRSLAQPDVLDAFDDALRPPGAATARQQPGEWLSDSLTLWFQRRNAALRPIHEQFCVADQGLDARITEAVDDLRGLLAGPHAQDSAPGAAAGVLEVLDDIATRGGDTLADQVAYLRSRYAHLMDEALLSMALRVQDALDEARVRGALGGPAPDYAPDYAGLEPGARYSHDADWMPNLVLLAKNAHVWLSQLSRHYEADLRHLDHIPDAELDALARRGITGLWLIGLWERCDASRRIKRLAGNHRAEASAYSLEDYRISEALGGEPAYRRLRERARARGVRLAADMVPNHMGLTSRWVREQPDWFLSAPTPPYPAYTFNGPDLCDHPDLSVRVDDHYFDHTDAAVVFEHVDHNLGRTRYIYHGNDGTSTPWNDTAQIDYLNPDAREAVIQQIIDVARKFPIIRFDAAMTLVKKHVQRLWFPAPGHGGAIPSRSRYGLSHERFEALMPREFWREVVDRVALEAPDTLLLAEAFWMLEGYFVRTLGMHRVYNSAFMHKLRDEDNAGYRDLMIETLTFDPQILRRFVNFMNNPDEETAIEQFGDGDKYFGVCTMMATLPGLPMVGHGQVEGLREKYGMEFVAPRLDEQPNEGLVARHQAQIFPLFKQRALFAGVDAFRLYAPTHVDGEPLDDVFAYSNQLDGQRALVLYHNRFDQAHGFVRRSVPFREGDAIIRVSLLEGLGLAGVDLDAHVLRAADLRTGLDYVYDLAQLAERGLPFALDAYEVRVFIDLQVVADPDGRLRALASRLGGAGVPDVARELRLDDLRARHGQVREALQRGADAIDDAYPDELRAQLAACDFLASHLRDQPKIVEEQLLEEPISAALRASPHEGPPHPSTHDPLAMVTTAATLWVAAEVDDVDPGVSALDRVIRHAMRVEVSREFLLVNTYEGREYFDRDAFEALLELVTRWLEAHHGPVEGLRSRAVHWRLHAQRVGYDLTRFLQQA